MKKLFSLVLTLLLFIGFTPINNAHAEEFQTTVSIPLYEDAEFLEYEEETQATEIETSEGPLTSVAPLLA